MIRREWQNRQPDCMMTVGDKPCNWVKGGKWTNPRTGELFQIWYCEFCNAPRYELIDS